MEREREAKRQSGWGGGAQKEVVQLGNVALRALQVLTLIAALGVSGAANAAWTQVYYELGNTNSQSGTTSVGPAAIPVIENTGQPVATTQSIGKAAMSASASVGILKASIWNVADVQPLPLTGGSDHTWSHAAARFFDFITLPAPSPDLNGQTVTVNASFLLSGSMSADWALWGNNSQEYSVSARTTLSLLGTGVSLPFLKAEEFHSHSGTGGDFNRSVPAPSVIPVSFTATLGSRTGVQYNLDLWGESFAIFGFRECGGGYGPCGAIASAELTADYAHSLLWGGISSVTDANGNPVVLTSALGETGFNYMWAAQSPPQPPPIPEPSTVLLLGAGLMGLGVWGRKRMKG